MARVTKPQQLLKNYALNKTTYHKRHFMFGRGEKEELTEGRPSILNQFFLSDNFFIFVQKQTLRVFRIDFLREITSNFSQKLKLFSQLFDIYGDRFSTFKLPYFTPMQLTVRVYVGVENCFILGIEHLQKLVKIDISCI